MEHQIYARVLIVIDGKSEEVYEGLQIKWGDNPTVRNFGFASSTMDILATVTAEVSVALKPLVEKVTAKFLIERGMLGESQEGTVGLQLEAGSSVSAFAEQQDFPNGIGLKETFHTWNSAVYKTLKSLAARAVNDMYSNRSESEITETPQASILYMETLYKERTGRNSHYMKVGPTGTHSKIYFDPYVKWLIGIAFRSLKETEIREGKSLKELSGNPIDPKALQNVRNSLGEYIPFFNQSLPTNEVLEEETDG